ncbi:hypothetical protein ES705_30771 [subsurface metagenome]
MKKLQKGELNNRGNFLLIGNTKLFNELQENPKWETLFKDDQGTLKDKHIPILAGGLDHIERNDWGIYFYDIGTTKGHYNRIIDNSFGIVRE